MENQNEKSFDSAQGKFKVWWDEEKQIIRTKFWGDQDENSAGGALNEVVKIIETKPNVNLLLLGDLSEATTASSNARKKFVEIAKLKIKKQAYFGASTLARVITAFVLRFAGVTTNKYFATEEEAMKWLKEK